MTRRVCLSAPPPTNRIDGIRPFDWSGLPELGDVVVVQVHGDRRWWRLARVCEVDREEGRYNVEVIDANGS